MSSNICLDNPQAVQLTCKVLGDTGKALYLKDEDDFDTTMEHLCQRGLNVRMCSYIGDQKYSMSLSSKQISS